MYDSLIIFGAQYLIGIIALFFLLYFFLAYPRKRQRMLLLSLISLPLAYVLGKLAGYFYLNPRPFVVDQVLPLITHAANNGFPSDHTLFSAALATVVFLFNRRLGIFLWVLALLVGVSRVLAGVHHPIDIAAGAAISAASVYVVHALLRHTRWWHR